MSCVLRRNRHSAGRSPIAHLIVRMSSARNRRLLCSAPAKERTASRCSCRSPVGPGALIGASLTCGSDAIPVLLRSCSLIPPRAALYPCNTRSLSALRTGGVSTEAKAPWDRGCGPNLSAFCWAPVLPRTRVLSWLYS